MVSRQSALLGYWPAPSPVGLEVAARTVRLAVTRIASAGEPVAASRSDEEAADHLAATLLFDDMLSTGSASRLAVELRVAALRLFFAVLEHYEDSCFLVQPTSHPKASMRWQTLLDQDFSIWFNDLDEALRTSAPFSENDPRVGAGIAAGGPGGSLPRIGWTAGQGTMEQPGLGPCGAPR